MSKLKDLTGQKFGSLTVTGRDENVEIKDGKVTSFKVNGIEIAEE